MKEVADNLNFAIQDHENRSKCIEIQRDLSDSIQIVDAHRRFIYEGDLLKQCRKEKKVRKFWLFNDMIVYGFPQPGIGVGKYFISRKLDLSNLSVLDISDNDSQDIKYAIQLSESSKSFLVFGSNQEDKAKWLEQLTNTLSDYKLKEQTLLKETTETPYQHTAPVWIPDESVDKCPICSVKFTLIKRKHHCRKCGTVVCSDCSSNNLFLPNISTKKVRVCDNCFKSNNKS